MVLIRCCPAALLALTWLLTAGVAAPARADGALLSQDVSALFEIDAGSPELKSILSGWINDSRQRLAIDDGLLQLVNLLLMRVRATSAPAQAG